MRREKPSITGDTGEGHQRAGPSLASDSNDIQSFQSFLHCRRSSSLEMIVQLRYREDDDKGNLLEALKITGDPEIPCQKWGSLHSFPRNEIPPSNGSPPLEVF